MRYAERVGNKVRKQRHARVRPEEFLSGRKQRWVQDVFDSGKIDLSIFHVGVISVRDQRASGEEQKQNA